MKGHFAVRLDTTCSTHIHLCWAHGSHTVEELRSLAKAVVFWEPATAHCAPPSRQDRATAFCCSNLKPPVLAAIFRQHGPIRGLPVAFKAFDDADRDEVINLVCPSKYIAWNFKPARSGGPGSIQFRRPPGVASAKKMKHWIAFAATFAQLTLKGDVEKMAQRMIEAEGRWETVHHPNFVKEMERCAWGIGLYTIGPEREYCGSGR